MPGTKGSPSGQLRNVVREPPPPTLAPHPRTSPSHLSRTLAPVPHPRTSPSHLTLAPGCSGGPFDSGAGPRATIGRPRGGTDSCHLRLALGSGPGRDFPNTSQIKKTTKLLRPGKGKEPRALGSEKKNASTFSQS